MQVGLMQVYYAYKSHYSEEKYLRSELKDLKKAYSNLELEKYFVDYHYKEFQQNVAGLLPDAIKKQPYSYSLRNIASVVDNPAPIKLEDATSLFEQGRKLYNEKEFEMASTYFKKIVNFYTDSVHLPESLFMLSESYYQMADYERATDGVEFLVEQFPEHVLTGYALLRLGKIYEKHDRVEDAIMAYALIRDRFQQKDLVEQATKMLEGLQ